MRGMPLFVLLLASISTVYGRPEDTQFCGTSGNYTVLGTDGTFGCNGYGNSVYVVFNVTDPNPRMLTFLSFNTESCCDFVTILYAGNTLGPFSGTTNPGAFMFGGGDILVIFKSDPSGTYPGFSIEISSPPPMDTLKSSQPFPKTISSGGFSYFALPGTVSGLLLSVSLTINSFDGLQSPSLFMRTNALPTLEAYGYLNNSVPVSGGRYAASFNIPSPPGGTYYFGVFLYGNVAAVNLVATWTYNFPPLVNGVKNTTSVGSNALYFQLYTPKLTKSLNFQISRQVPGGFPIAYIAQGYVPNAVTHGWVMDTTVNSYISLTINSPNPTVNYNPNPGNYYVTVISSSGDVDVICSHPVIARICERVRYNAHV